MTKLQKVFNELNTEHFAGKLPTIEVFPMNRDVNKGLAMAMGVYKKIVIFGYFYTKDPTILINDLLLKDTELLKLIMLHEMRHYRKWLKGDFIDGKIHLAKDEFDKSTAKKFDEIKRKFMEGEK